MFSMFGIGAADNEEVEEQSGASRLCGSIWCAVCVAPIIVLGCVFTLGWNERRAVCDMKAIVQGSDEVVPVGCTSAAEGAGSLVTFSCELSQADLPPLTAPNSDFQSAINFKGTGMATYVEMYQCVEDVRSETKKNAVGGGTRTVTTYTYSKQWRAGHENSRGFERRSSDSFRDNCGADNPEWPAGLPQAGRVFQSSAKAGAFTLPKDYVERVPIYSPVTGSSTPAGWTVSDGKYESSRWEVASSGPAAGIGKVRVRFEGNDWSVPMVTVLGRNDGGTIKRWTASSSWLCSGFTLADLRQGVVDKETLFAQLKAGSSTITYIFRLVGFLMMWFGFSLVLGPLEVVADCVPCIGPWLGDGIATITCCLSCLPACACTLGVVGVIWIAMRPMVGGPLLAVFFLVTCGFVGFKCYARANKQGGGGGEEGKP